jgi:hypothetical protein
MQACRKLTIVPLKASLKHELPAATARFLRSELLPSAINAEQPDKTECLGQFNSGRRSYR